ncbi:MAG: hypothetical protein IJH37_08820 [Clostridia bacterium]|nr:hypothetical protein [Clostridia bacterium]
MTKPAAYGTIVCENKQKYSFSPYGAGFAVNIVSAICADIERMLCARFFNVSDTVI